MKKQLVCLGATLEKIVLKRYLWMENIPEN